MMSWYHMISNAGALIFFERSLMIGQFAVSCVFMVFAVILRGSPVQAFQSQNCIWVESSTHLSNWASLFTQWISMNYQGSNHCFKVRACWKMVEKGQSFGSIPSSTGQAEAGPFQALRHWNSGLKLVLVKRVSMAALMATFRSFWKFLFLITSDMGFFFSQTNHGQHSEKSTSGGLTVFDSLWFPRGCIMTTKSTEKTFQIIR